LQTYNHRGHIIDQHYDNNPQFWAEVQKVYDALGTDGMSSDETDDETTPEGLKKVRRVAKVWLSEGVSLLWEHVEQYHHGRERQRQGNRPYARIFMPKHSSNARAICSLPKNYYNSLWWTSLISVDQHDLEAKEEVTLPDGNMYVIPHSCLRP
jgi:hypothetical protein